MHTRPASQRLFAILGLSAALFAAVPVEAAVKCPIRLGNVRPESGVMASIGQSLANSLKMALEEVNAKGGIAGCQVELVSYDTQSVPATAATLARRLVNQDQVPLIISTPISIEVLAMMEVTENAGVPLYVPSAASAKVTSQGFKWVWRQSMIDAHAATAMVNYIVDDLKWKRVGIVYENTDFAKPAFFNILKPGLEAKGVVVTTSEAIHQGDTDLSSQLLRMRDAKSDGILFWAHPKEAKILLTQNIQLKTNLPVAAGSGIVYPEFLEILPADVQAQSKLVAIAQFAWTTEDPSQKAWIESYRAKFKRDPDATSIDGYDAVFVLKKAIEAAGSMEPDALQAALRKVSYDGVGGSISFDETGQAMRPLTIIELTPKDGPGLKVVRVMAPARK